LLLKITLKVDPLRPVIVGIVVVAGLAEQKLRFVLGAALLVTVEHSFQLPARAKWKLLQYCLIDSDSSHCHFKERIY
jgi:hypothetical protein